ncbi:hypothetical protein BV20DRAFT_1126050 [Pilatotrama ljubarskyi]|nr:hypothetical protein BV20DRAFT_1126050 [Pilatotrama ljubarskyi]
MQRLPPRPIAGGGVLPLKRAQHSIHHSQHRQHTPAPASSPSPLTKASSLSPTMGSAHLAPFSTCESALRRRLQSRPFRLYLLGSCTAVALRMAWSKFSVAPHINVPPIVDVALGALVGFACGAVVCLLLLRILLAMLGMSQAGQQDSDIDESEDGVSEAWYGIDRAEPENALIDLGALEEGPTTATAPSPAPSPELPHPAERGARRPRRIAPRPYICTLTGPSSSSESSPDSPIRVPRPLRAPAIGPSDLLAYSASVDGNSHGAHQATGVAARMRDDSAHGEQTASPDGADARLPPNVPSHPRATSTQIEEDDFLSDNLEAPPLPPGHHWHEPGHLVPNVRCLHVRPLPQCLGSVSPTTDEAPAPRRPMRGEQLAVLHAAGRHGMRATLGPRAGRAEGGEDPSEDEGETLVERQRRLKHQAENVDIQEGYSMHSCGGAIPQAGDASAAGTTLVCPSSPPPSYHDSFL